MIWLFAALAVLPWSALVLLATATDVFNETINSRDPRWLVGIAMLVSLGGIVGLVVTLL